MKKWLITALICFFLVPVLINATATDGWKESMNGTDNTGRTGSCDYSDSCFCRWSHSDYFASIVTVGYYENKKLVENITKTPVIVYNYGAFSYSATVLKEYNEEKKYILKKYNVWPDNTSKGLAINIRNLLMDPGPANNYQNMQNFFRDVLFADGNSNYTYETMLNKVKDGLDGKSNWKEGGFGTNVGTGVRIVIRPIFITRTNSKCTNKEIYLAGTLSELIKAQENPSGSRSYFSNALSQLDQNLLSSKKILGPYHYNDMAMRIFSSVDDILLAAREEYKSYTRYKAEDTGWATGLIAPFAHLVDGVEVPIEPTGCNYEPVTEYPVCTSESYGYISDIKNWKCIFDSVNNPSEEVKTRYIKAEYPEGGGSKYCNVYCRQEISAELPGNKLTLSQGRYATVGFEAENIPQLIPVRYTGLKECRVTSNNAEGKIDVKSFEEDYKHYNSKLPALWTDYQQKLANYNVALKTISSDCTEKSWCSSHDYEDADKIACQKDEDYDECIAKKSKTKCTGTTYEYTCTANEETIKDTKIGKFKGGYSFVYQTHNKKSEDADFRSALSTDIAKKEGVREQKENAEKAYTENKNARDAALNSINSCTHAAEQIDYSEYNPEVLFKYDEPIYGNYNSDGWKLEKSSSDSRIVKYYDNGNSVTGDGNPTSLESLTVAISSYLCNWGEDCIESSVPYYKTTWWDSYTYKKNDYILPNNVYRYILKTGESKDTLEDFDKNSMQYIDVGYGNMPIHYSTKPGNYAYKIQVNGFGNKNSMNKYLGNFGNYDCNYNVSCDDILISSCDEYVNICGGRCPMSGLNVIYRTISLYSKVDAFPGIDGKGRTPGDNWNNDKLINDYIVNNRGVKDYEVYRIDPLYEIELTPGLMKIIRKYNKEQNKTLLKQYWKKDDSQGVIAGYADFSNMVCDQEGKNCISSLLRGQVSGYNEIKVKGCAINGTGYTNCGTSV